MLFSRRVTNLKGILGDSDFPLDKTRQFRICMEQFLVPVGVHLACEIDEIPDEPLLLQSINASYQFPTNTMEFIPEVDVFWGRGVKAV